MINLKQFYDAAKAADASVTKIANEINALFEAGDNQKAFAMKEQLDKLQVEAKGANDLYLSMREAAQGGEKLDGKFLPVGGTPPAEQSKDLKDLLASKEYFDKYFQALKMGVSLKTINSGQHRREEFAVLINALSGDGESGAEGGFLQPVDFDNKIHELQRAMVDLSTYMNVENVTTLTGWRAVEEAAVTTGLAALTPQVTGTVTEITEEPEFAKVEFTLADYAGYLPISNDLLSDTPVALMNYVARFFAKKEVNTKNILILALIDALTTPGNVALKDMEDAMRTALNSTLDPAVSVQATIFTNSTGFDLMDQLEDGQGRPFLQPDPTLATLYRYKGRPIVRLSDALWPLQSSRAPVAIGWGQEYITLFRKAALEFTSTNIGGNAWRYNNTEVRGIMRAHAKEIDKSSMTLLTVATA